MVCCSVWCAVLVSEIDLKGKIPGSLGFNVRIIHLLQYYDLGNI